MADGITIIGTVGDDVIEGGFGNDVIDGNAGNDTITDLYGSNLIFDGAGNDYLEVSASDNYVILGSGNDHLVVSGPVSGHGITNILLGSGDDTIELDQSVWLKLAFQKKWIGNHLSSDWYYTDSPPTTGVIVNHSNSSQLISGILMDPNTAIDGFGDVDSFIGTQGYSVFGTTHDDTIYTDNWLHWETSEGHDRIIRSENPFNELTLEHYWIATPINWDLTENIFYFSSEDGTQNSLTVEGDVNNVWAGDQSDTVHGNELSNRIGGRGGDDQLYGGLGDDQLDGGSGNDYLRGEAGNNTVTGGAGTDFFVLDPEGISEITDY